MTSETLPRVRFDVITLFPDMIRPVVQFGITGRALRKGLIKLQLWNPRDYAHDRHRTVDDRPYGGGPGMVMKVEPLGATIQDVRAAAGEQVCVIYLSPQGRRLDQDGVQTLLQRRKLVLVAGRYEGIDERLITQEVDEEWSIGDYVLSGGELAALVLIDAICRLIPGSLGHESSAQQDSHMEGRLDFPHYTRPEEIHGHRVPKVLLSGDHGAIGRWRYKQTLGRTWLRRPDLLKNSLSKDQQMLLEEFVCEWALQTESIKGRER